MKREYFKAVSILFLVMLGYGLTTALLSVYLNKLGVNLTNIGFIFAIGAIVAGLLRVPIGVIVDCIGRKKFLIFGSIGYPLFALGLVYANEISQFIFLKLLIELFGAVFWTAFSAHFFDIMLQGKEGSSIGLRNVLMYSASGIAPVLAGFFATKFGFQNLFLIGAAITASAVFLALTIKDFNHKNKLCYLAISKEFNHIQQIPGIKLIAAILFIVDAVFVFWAIFMPIYLQQQGVSLELIGVILSMNLLVGVLLQIPLGRAIDKLPMRTILIPGFFLYWLGGMIFFAFRNYASYLIGRIVVGIGSDAAYWPAVGMLAKLTPKTEHGGATALIFGLSAVITGISSLIGGFLTAKFGIARVLFWVSFVPLIAAAVLIPAKLLRKRGTQIHKLHHQKAHIPRH